MGVAGEISRNMLQLLWGLWWPLRRSCALSWPGEVTSLPALALQVVQKSKPKRPKKEGCPCLFSSLTRPVHESVPVYQLPVHQCRVCLVFFFKEVVQKSKPKKLLWRGGCPCLFSSLLPSLCREDPTVHVWAPVPGFASCGSPV